MSLLLAVAIAGVVWVGMDALRAPDELKAAAVQVQTLQGQVEKNDRKAAATRLTSLQEHASVARAASHGLHWSAIRALPWLGPNVAAVQAVSDVIDGLAVDALPALMGHDLARTDDPGAREGSR